MTEMVPVHRYERIQKAGQDACGHVGYRFFGVSSGSDTVQEVEVSNGRIIEEGRYHSRTSLANLGAYGLFEPLSYESQEEQTTVEEQPTYTEFLDFAKKTFEQATSRFWDCLTTREQIEIALVIKQAVINAEGVEFVRRS